MPWWVSVFVVGALVVGAQLGFALAAYRAPELVEQKPSRLMSLSLRRMPAFGLVAAERYDPKNYFDPLECSFCQPGRLLEPGEVFYSIPLKGADRTGRVLPLCERCREDPR